MTERTTAELIVALRASTDPTLAEQWDTIAFVRENADDLGIGNIADTCCGKCGGDTCYVDQLTGERE